jgi:Holliday junction resolvase-like predicted endonuclease
MVSSHDAEAFSTFLDWKQFEGLAELALRSFGYKTVKNYRLKKPAQEIDLLAVSGKVAFGIDCKHWKRTVGQATMLTVAEKQVKRCERLIETESINRIIPVILTWRDEQLRILENGVAVVPIQKISDFILNWESSNAIRVVRKIVTTQGVYQTKQVDHRV